MDHCGKLLGEKLLERPAARVLTVLLDGGVDCLLVKKGEYLDISLSVLVADIQPELVELVRGGLLRIEPDVAFLRLSELGSVGLAYERASEGERVGLAEHPADELRSGGDVAPLVASAKLETAALVLVEPEVVVALEQLVAELCEGHSLTGFAGKTLLHGVLGHHIVDCDVLAHVPDEVQERVVLHPVVVVHELRLVRRVGVEVQDP